MRPALAAARKASHAFAAHLAHAFSRFFWALSLSSGVDMPEHWLTTNWVMSVPKNTVPSVLQVRSSSPIAELISASVQLGVVSAFTERGSDTPPKNAKAI